MTTTVRVSAPTVAVNCVEVRVTAAGCERYGVQAAETTGLAKT